MATGVATICRQYRCYAADLAGSYLDLRGQRASRPEVYAPDSYAASQVLGMALTRYVLRFPAIVELGHDDLVAWIAPTLQRYLTGERD